MYIPGGPLVRMVAALTAAVSTRLESLLNKAEKLSFSQTLSLCIRTAISVAEGTLVGAATVFFFYLIFGSTLFLFSLMALANQQ